MSTPRKIPEIMILPSAVATGETGNALYAWRMRLDDESTLDSEDHGDDFGSVTEALAHAYDVFRDLVDIRKLYPNNTTQEFKLIIRTS